MLTAFRQSENQLRRALKERQAEVKAFYGDLTFADNQYGGSKGNTECCNLKRCFT